MNLFRSAFLAAAMAQAVSADVIINEIVATNSDRLLVRESGEPPRVGNSISWHKSAFDDALWKTGPGPFGFGNVGVVLGTNVASSVFSRTPSLYLRKKFSVSSGNAGSGTTLQLAIRYNDGFIAYLNGKEIARRNMGFPGMFAYRDQTSFSTSGNGLTTINIGAANQNLVSGENTLAIQVHNNAVTGGGSDSLLLAADLKLQSGAVLSDGATNWRYFGGNAEPSGGLIDHGLLAQDLGSSVLIPWTTRAFNDSAWQTGIGPVGFERSDPPDYTLGVNLQAEMFNITPSVYIRSAFTVSQAEADSSFPLSLNADYDDGLIVFVNGKEVLRRNMGTSDTVVPHDATATGFHNATGDNGVATAVDETVSLGAAKTFLKPGENVLAIQVHNSAVNSSDVIAMVTLSSTGSSPRALVSPNDAVRYFVGTDEPATPAEEEDTSPGEEPSDSENDWIELHNNGTVAVSLDGWTLSDDPDELGMWSFPAGASIPANGYYIVLATDLNLTPAEDGTTYPHTNFKLSSGGDRLFLTDAGGNPADAIANDYPAQSWRFSYGRQTDGGFGYLGLATPGGPNAGPALDVSPAAPAFSIQGGFHPAAVSVALSSTTSGAEIRYTTDGSDPTDGVVYTSPVSISSNGILRARSFAADSIPSEIVTHTYLIGENASRQGLAAICLGGDERLTFYGPNASGGPSDGEGIFSINGGRYSGNIWEADGDSSAFHYPSLRGRAGEKPATLEFLPVAGAPLRNGIGLRISGSGFSRPRYRLNSSPDEIFPATASTQKPSFNMYFRSEFGDRPIEYPFFPGHGVQKFQDIRIRAGKNDISNPFIKDEMLRRIFINTGQEGSFGSFNTLWINGVYKGFYNMTERLREGFMQEHHGGEELWDVQQVNEFSDGDPVHWNAMWAYLRSADLSSVAGYEGVKEYLDVDNYIDYILVNAYAAMWDWPNNNWVAGRERSSLGRWRFYMWDAEGAFGQSGRNTTYNTFTSDLTLSTSEANTTSNKYIPALYTLLKNSPEFRLRFADRAQKQLFNDGALVKSNMTSIFNELKNEINPIMQDTIGQTVSEGFHNSWVVSDSRRNNLFSQMTSQGTWPSTPAPTANQHGGGISAGFQMVLSTSESGAEIYFTTDGSDPRAPGGAVVGVEYTTPVAINASTRVRARVRPTSGNWSPEIDLSFAVPFAQPTFLPTGDGDWTSDANWSSSPAPYPNGDALAAAIPGAFSDERKVDLRAPVTIGSLVFQQGDSENRTRVRDRSSGNSLSFSDSSGNASVVVEGNGEGFAEFEVEAGVVLASDLTLDVRNILGDPEHGALRLREQWSGAGGLVKTGPGIASMTGEGKIYSGPTTITQGVLNVSEPASPVNSPSISVMPGGQLRLSSGTDPGEAARAYSFGGPITIRGNGRGPEIADGQNQGKAGAIRYEVPGTTNRASVSAPVVLSGPADIHVANAGNVLEFSGPVTGNFALSKTGGGTMKLSGDNSARTFPTLVENGSLEISGVNGYPVFLSPTGILRGHGVVGPVSGEGRILIPSTRLDAPSSTASSYSLIFGKTGLPLPSIPDASGNSAFFVDSAPTGILSIDLYLTDVSPANGAIYQGGIITPVSADLGSAIRDANISVFVPDAGGSIDFEGSKWSPLASWTLTSSATTLPPGSPWSMGRVLELRIGNGPPVDFNQWRDAQFTDPGDLGNPLVSGPFAKPFGDGVTNLMRYAMSVPPGADASSYLPVHASSGENHGLSFPFESGRDDINVVVEVTDNLLDWSGADALFDSAIDFPPPAADGRITILDSGPVVDKRFYRVRVSQK